ncbi:class I SAM-dependent methyltransferase [Methanocaldococcus indicus]|uniref:class I SAM-dependent methyltransferase n=1 Tax=Methanocaldococcus indicus TaxID=213231 RepID=UPI003C6CE2C7
MPINNNNLDKLNLDISSIFSEYQPSENDSSDILSKSLRLKKKIEMADKTIDYLGQDLLTTFIRQGIEFGIFQNIAQYHPNVKELLDKISYPNKQFILEFVKTGANIGIINYSDGKLSMNEDFEIKIKMPEFDKIISDYVMKYTYITHVAKYALISSKHPKIAINFKKDPDIWDMILSSPYYHLCREISTLATNLECDDCILDVGCGSWSPYYYIGHVHLIGHYTGIDISKGLIEIAKNRVKRRYFDSYDLRAMDFYDMAPKEKYSLIICSHTLRYLPSLKTFIKKSMNSLVPGGRLFIMEEYFADKFDPIKNELFTFYNKLNDRFVKYYEVNEIINTLDSLGYDYKIKLLGNSCLTIEKI